MSSDFDPYHVWLGVPPEEQPPNHYRLLGLPLFEATPEAIEHAADRQMAHLRTLQTGKHGALSQKLLNEVATARVYLLNPEKKAAYDRQLRDTTESASADEPAFDFSPTPAVTEKRAATHEPLPDGSEKAVRTKLPLVIGAVGVGLLLLIGLIFAGLGLTGGRPPDAVLIFNWPNEVRQETKLQIDGKWSAVPQSKGPIEHSCKPGEHRIMAQREGYKQWEKVIQLEPGERLEISPDWRRQAYLVLQWPASERQNATIEIDGQQPDISTLVPRPGPTGIKLPLDTGRHVVRITRQGFEPFEQTVAIVEGRDAGLRPVWKRLSSPVEPLTAKEDMLGPSSDGPWISLLPSPKELIGWKVPSEGVKYEDGIVELENTHIFYRPVTAKDMVIRAKVKKLTGKTPALLLRRSVSGGYYSAVFNGGKSFGIGKLVPEQGFKALKSGRASKSHNDFFEMEFSVVGDTLTLRADGEEVIRVRDQSHSSGMCGLKACEAQAQFSRIEVRVLDEGWKPPPGLVAAPDSKPEEVSNEGPSIPSDDAPWISLLSSPDELIGWKVPGRGLKYADGVVEIDNAHMRYPPVIAKDMVVRAKLKKLEGQAAAFALRISAEGTYYYAVFTGGNSFTVGKAVHGQGGRQFKVLENANARRSFNDFFEMEFAAIGDTLILRVDGQELIRVRDQSVVSGTVSIGAIECRAQFAQVEVRVLDKGWTPPPSLVVTPKAKATPKPVEIDPALKLQRELHAKFAAVLKPVETMASAWDFSGAVAALAKIKFDEPELMSRRNARGRELRRLVRLKERMIAKINAADPPLKKSDLMLRGINGEVAKADEKSVTAKLPSGKTESHAWGELGEKTRLELVKLVIDRENADDCLSAGLLAFAAGDIATAEKFLTQAQSRGAEVGPYLASLAERAFGRANELLEKKDFGKAAAALADIEKKYGKTPWFASRRKALEVARSAAKSGGYAAEAEKLYVQAAKLFEEHKRFDLKPLVDELKADYADSRPVTDADRQPSFAEMEQAVANLGKRITVRSGGKADYRVIQEAVDAAPANSLIEIQDVGPFSEIINVPQEKTGLTIRGKKGVWPILAGAPDRNVLTIGARDMVAERLIVIGNLLVTRGPATLRRSVLSTILVNDVSSLHVDTCVYTKSTRVGRVKLTVSNSVWLQGGIRAETWGAPAAFDNVAVNSINATGITPCELQRCTVAESLMLGVKRNVVADCIIGKVDSQGSASIDCCNVLPGGYAGVAAPGKNCISVDPRFVDPKIRDFRLDPKSPCRGKASDGGDLGVRYTPEMLEMIKLAYALRERGIVKF